MLRGRVLIDVAARLAASASRPAVAVVRRGCFERGRRRALFFEAPNLVQVRGDFGDEAGGALEDGLSGRIVGDHQRVGDVELVAGACEGDVPEAAFFLFALSITERA